MNRSLSEDFLQALAGDVAEESVPDPALGPAHVVYGGAHLFRKDTIAKLGAAALRAFRTYAVDAEDFAESFGGMPTGVAEKVFSRVSQKLSSIPVEDYRIDFEDGYGVRPDREEDADAMRVGGELALARAAQSLSPAIGIRVKPISSRSTVRALRTLDLVLTEYVRQGGSDLPPEFCITLPKVSRAIEVDVLSRALDELELQLGISSRSIRIEAMVETTRLFVSGTRDVLALEEVATAGAGRLRALHFGAYDYTAELGIGAGDQVLAHPACDAARNTMQLVAARYGLGVSDGATTTMPIPPHRREPLSDPQMAENRSVVRHAWRLHANDVRRSLSFGIYQGWDLHPAQIPTRFGALYAFFLGNLDSSAQRLSNFMANAAQASRVGTAFDDAATGQGLLNFFLRGAASGALTQSEVASSGLTPEELATRSFARILEMRRA